MSELHDFQRDFLPGVIEAEASLHRGDAGPRLAMWSEDDPVTLFGAWGPCNSGWAEVSQSFAWVASRFSNGENYRLDLVAVDVRGDMAYTVGFEHCTVSVDGGPPRPQTVRATHVYRRENGEWRVVHRHGDLLPIDQSPPAPPT